MRIRRSFCIIFAHMERRRAWGCGYKLYIHTTCKFNITDGAIGTVGSQAHGYLLSIMIDLVVMVYNFCTFLVKI